MNILHVISCVDVRYGGPSQVIRHVVREQVCAGHEVTVLATTAQHAERWDSEETFMRGILSDPNFAGADVYLGTAYGRRSIWASFSFSPQCSRWLRHRLKSNWRPDIVHIHGAFAHLTTIAAAWARHRSIPYVIRPAGSLNSRWSKMGHSRIKAVFLRLVLRRDLRCAARIVAASHSEADQLAQLVSPQRIRMIPLGADLPSFDATMASKHFLAAFPQLNGRRVVLFLSRVTAIKRPELLVEAVAHLRQVGNINRQFLL